MLKTLYVNFTKNEKEYRPAYMHVTLSYGEFQPVGHRYKCLLRCSCIISPDLYYFSSTSSKSRASPQFCQLHNNYLIWRGLNFLKKLQPWKQRLKSTVETAVKNNSGNNGKSQQWKQRLKSAVETTVKINSGNNG